MTDIFSTAKRSQIMSAIKSKGTTPEIIVRKALFKVGFRYRLNVQKLPGKPDIVLPKWHTVIFVNGCFWHGHKGCKHFRPPHSHLDYWYHKIRNNVARDAIAQRKLMKLGWRVGVVWECGLHNQKEQQKTMKLLIAEIRFGADQQFEISAKD